ncbi:hypothetical protein ACE01N_09060 [Saccharicrinis sp. FJH2]|uniref:hypothetical protein n=1 Tax=Saccharicrinis sp. FJH65 TaxID=3344659 RepID=UPI0035F3997B
MRSTMLVCTGLLLSGITFAQTDWSKVDFAEKYKLEVKIPGKAAKSLEKNKTFVNSYVVSQATTMKGSEKSATKAVYSEVSLAGLDNATYQIMVNELYQDFVKDLKRAGIIVTNGDDAIASDYAQKRLDKIKDSEFIGKTGDNPAYEGKKKITDGAIPGYGAWAVTRDVSFPPSNANQYTSSNIVTSGLFYQNMATKENFNLLSIHFYVAFANFEGGKGYKSINLATKPVMSVNAQVMLMAPGGAYGKIFFKKLPVWASTTWSEGIVKGKDNKDMSDFLGLARSADYEVTANSEAYVNELKSIIKKLQADIVSEIKAQL